MPTVTIENILSVSSEDPAHLAINLLKSDTNKKWKCKSGEKQASVILQLKQETVIAGIDIGNENSAFVEVLVGKSTSLTNDFQVLLVASSLMTLKESKDGSNSRAVRFFKKENFTQPTANEKWDRLKIVCTQPFNKHVQYGLSFVVLHSTSDQSVEGESSSSLGKFSLKEENEEQVSVGSWFAKRKDPPPPLPQGAAASIRDASSPAILALGKTKKPTPKRPKNTTPKNGAVNPTKDESSKQTPAKGPLVVKKDVLTINMNLGDEDSPADDTDADSTYSPNKDKRTVLSEDDMISSLSDEEEDSRKREKRPKRNKQDSKNNNVLNGGSTSKRKADTDDSSKAKHAKIDRETKPFNRLLEGVTFAISGYQNPSRGELRSKACAMGAKYRPDWDNTCTHLICAFVNTPKFNQVRGRGKIVKKDWIEECFNRRRRLPWRRFALDRYDIGTSSEEEVWEEGSIPTTSSATVSAATANTIASGVNRRRVSSGSDTEEEIERVRARQTGNKPNTPKNKVDKPKNQSTKTPDKKSDPFEDDTDMDSEGESPTASLPLPSLPAFFDNIVFYIGRDIHEEERRVLKRYIIAYKGCVVDDLEGSVEYVITKSSDIAAEVSEEFGVGSVNLEWIWECSDAGKLIPVTEYLL